MKYFIDTEFHEYSKQPTIRGLKIGKPIDTIELISIGIVSEITESKMVYANNKLESNTKTLHPSREYYAICKDFDLKAAWNNEWLRENVLKSIFNECIQKETNEYKKALNIGVILKIRDSFMFNNFKYLINKYGKTREKIAEEIKRFVYSGEGIWTHPTLDESTIDSLNWKEMKSFNPEFYAYYADYDWVVFCWLFGRMVDLPKGFPMYCIDLKQELDRKVELTDGYGKVKLRTLTVEEKLKFLKDTKEYPKQTNEHNALADAKWNYELYKFLKQL